MAKIIDGKVLSKKLIAEISDEITLRKQKRGLRQPGLAVILVGDNPASQIYVRNKHQACQIAGMKSVNYAFQNNATEKEVIALINVLNTDSTIDGILVQLPLPEHINSETVLESIHPQKDIDGFHPYNIGRLLQRRPLLRPCTPFGVMLLLDSIKETYKNRHAVIIGASNIVGRPMACELMLAGCTITVCHRFTKDLEYFIKQADIVVAAVGKPGLVKGHWIKSGATVIDVGINRLANGSLAGDVEFAKAAERAEWITPVPGGVGPMTVAALLKNTLLAAKQFNM